MTLSENQQSTTGASSSSSQVEVSALRPLSIRPNACLKCLLCFTCGQRYGTPECKCIPDHPRRGSHLPPHAIDSRTTPLWKLNNPEDYWFTIAWLRQNAHERYLDEHAYVEIDRATGGLDETQEHREVSLCKADYSALARARRNHFQSLGLSVPSLSRSARFTPGLPVPLMPEALVEIGDVVRGSLSTTVTEHDSADNTAEMPDESLDPQSATDPGTPQAIEPINRSMTEEASVYSLSSEQENTGPSTQETTNEAHVWLQMSQGDASVLPLALRMMESSSSHSTTMASTIPTHQRMMFAPPWPASLYMQRFAFGSLPSRESELSPANPNPQRVFNPMEQHALMRPSLPQQEVVVLSSSSSDDHSTDACTTSSSASDNDTHLVISVFNITPRMGRSSRNALCLVPLPPLHGYNYRNLIRRMEIDSRFTFADLTDELSMRYAIGPNLGRKLVFTNSAMNRQFPRCQAIRHTVRMPVDGHVRLYVGIENVQTM
ncbi:uncharacterized protein BYT42DRAFT_602495 [Radiomyces spectabilis]|uniref:uncharacterized protein n=1 Tax=Radiomyces spectabilis TaxID=64574 RepID=UPI002220F5B6|nr:uncharacterized protein BYT42DRAFT_602495 [Radiomyces spectabilis]KAI8391734.1 hypothetical protein BYT42DRAFT_602495 [Radiomyces spectabilis]